MKIYVLYINTQHIKDHSIYIRVFLDCNRNMLLTRIDEKLRKQCTIWLEKS